MGGGGKGEVCVVWAGCGVVVSDFFLQRIHFFWGGGFFYKLTRNPNLTIFFFFFFWGGGGGGVGVG